MGWFRNRTIKKRTEEAFNFVINQADLLINENPEKATQKQLEKSFEKALREIGNKCKLTKITEGGPNNPFDELYGENLFFAVVYVYARFALLSDLGELINDENDIYLIENKFQEMAKKLSDTV